MFGLFQRKSAVRPVACPKTAKIGFVLGRLVSHWRASDSFVGAVGEDMPKQMTPDGIEVACDPNLMIGVTAGPTAFGIECANFPAKDLAATVAAVLTPGTVPDWAPDLGSDGGLCATLPLTDEAALRVTCLPCPVDPCFNNQRTAGARLIGHLQRV